MDLEINILHILLYLTLSKMLAILLMKLCILQEFSWVYLKHVDFLRCHKKLFVNHKSICIVQFKSTSSHFNVKGAIIFFRRGPKFTKSRR